MAALVITSAALVCGAPTELDELANYIDGITGAASPAKATRHPRLLASLADRTSGLVRRWQWQVGRLLPSPAVDIGWLQRELPLPEGNVTSEFYRVLADVQANVHSRVLTSQFVYVVVPGLFAHLSPGYFRPAIDRLRSLGLEVHYLSVDSSPGAQSMKNAERLKLALANVHRGSGGKPLVIIAHSKGVLDVSLALATSKSLRRATRALVSLQAPYGGAAIAEDIALGSESARDFLVSVLSIFHMGISSLDDLTYDQRRKALQAHGHLHAARPPVGRVVSLASRGPRSVAHPLALTGTYILRKHKADNDGLVCVDDAILPASLAIVVDDADHGTPVLPTLPTARLRGDDLVEAAITVALTPLAELRVEPWNALPGS